jgi:hypothetical protein
LPSFWHRLAQLNAPFIASTLRTLADEAELLFPGPPVMAFPIIFYQEEKPHMSEVTVRDSDAPLQATVTFLDAKGAVTAPDNAPVWTSDNEDVATVEANVDGLSATVTLGVPGAAVISVETVDTDGTDVVSQGTVTVQSGEAVVGSVEFAPGA